MMNFTKGQIVNVGEPTTEDFWQHPFMGTVVGVQGKIVSVEDQDGDVFDVDGKQVQEVD